MKCYASFIFIASALLFSRIAIAEERPVDDGRKSFTITMRGHKFEPFELVVPADEKIKISIRNYDDAPMEFDSYQLNRFKIVHPGREIPLLFNPLRAGTYSYYDAFSPDIKGFITVK